MHTTETSSVGTAWKVGVWVLGSSLVFAGCLRNWDDYGRDVGEECDADGDCRTGVCVPDASGMRVCTFSCDGSDGCIPGWACGGDGTCSCAGGTETCNALDDDCDGAIDEGACGSCVPRAEGCNAVDDDCDGIVDEGSAGTALCRPGHECSVGTCRCSSEVRPGSDTLDLLFVVDNSNSMAEEQASLVQELPGLLTALVHGDRDGDGAQDFVPPSSIHLGVVSTDMGTGGFGVPTCDRGTFGTMFGDDGILATRGREGTPGCTAAYPRVFELESGITDPIELANDVACVAALGTGGCGFEQQLEATLKAVSPSVPQEWTATGYTPPIFFAATLGHADRENAGFVRSGSTLGIVIVTDEEDCSVSDPEIFNPTSPLYEGDLNLRCWMFEETAAHPIARFVRGADGRSGLLGLRPLPGQLVVSVIAGVPVDAVSDPRAPDFAAVLAHPMMQNRLDPDAPVTAPRLAPSCNVPGRGVAAPPRRIVQVAQQLDAAGARVSLGSICQASYGGAFDALIDDVAESLTVPPECR